MRYIRKERKKEESEGGDYPNIAHKRAEYEIADQMYVHSLCYKQHLIFTTPLESRRSRSRNFIFPEKEQIMGT